jgi:hypothetical protein
LHSANAARGDRLANVLELALIERFLAVGCSDPDCRTCPARRRRRELVFAGVVGGSVAAFLIALFILILEMMGAK